MAIDPTTTTTVKVSELASAGYNTTDLIPHEVAGILKKGNLQDLATFIGGIISTEGAVGFRAVTVTDGQTLPATTEEEFILVGPGTYPNVGGGSAVTTTEPLNALVSNGTYWFIGVEIPISASGAWGSIAGEIENQADLMDALDLKADLVGGKVPASQLPSYVDDIVEVANYAALPTTGETGKIYVTLDNNKIFRWSGSAYIEIAANNAVWGSITGTLSAQTDLQSALNAKEGTITAGTTAQYWRGDKSWQTLNKTAVGLGNVDNTSDLNKPISTATQTALNAKFNNPTGNTTQYIAGDGSLITFPVAGQAGTLVREVRNTTGATLTKGTIVYISGATGNKPTVSKAIATSDSTSAQTFGMVQADISNNANGYVVCVGDLTGLNTSAIAEGAQLYLSSTTAGTYTTTKQLAPAHLVYIGVVTRSHATLGQIEVKIQNGYELDELHDVAISSKTNKDFLVYESSTDLWKNKSLGTIVGGTSSQFIKGDGSLDSTVYALDNTVVKITTNQNVRGIKTFLGDQTATTLKLIVADYYNDGFITSDNGMLRLLNGTTELFNLASTGDLTAKSFVKTGGTASQFLKANGTVDSTTYLSGTVAIANGGTGATTASAARTNLGATTIGSGLFTLPNAGLVSFLRVNADNTVELLGADLFRTSIGAGTGNGSVTSVSGTGSYGGLTLTGTVTGSGDLTLGGTPTGTWPISITGNASSVNTVQVSTNADFYLTFADANNGSPTSEFLYTIGTVKVNPSTGALTAGSFVKSGGTSSQYLMADGSVSTVAGVTGTGTTNYVPKFTGASAIGNSQIFDNGTNVLINNTTVLDSAVKLQVTGSSSGVSAFSTNADDVIFEHNTNLGLTFATPNTALATIAFADPENVLAGYLRFSHADNSMSFATDAVERMRITSTGNVGIGTTSPSAKLEILGSNSAAQFLISRSETPSQGFSIKAGGAQTIFNSIEGSNVAYGSYIFNSTKGTDTQERMAITSTGNVGIGTTTVPNTLSVGMASSTTGKGISLTSSAGIEYARFGVINSTVDNTSFIGSISNNNFAIYANNAERMRISQTGIVSIGGTSRQVGGADRLFQVEGTTNFPGTSIIRNTNDTGSPNIIMGKSRATVNGGVTIVQSGDATGTLSFVGANGVDLSSYTATITSNVDGTPSSTSMPGRLVFSTTASGAVASTERMRITSGGNVGIGTTSPVYKTQIVATGNALLQLNGNNTTGALDTGFTISADDSKNIYLYQRENAATIFGTNNAERMRITSGGNVGIGTTAPNQLLHIEKDQNTYTNLRVRNNDSGSSAYTMIGLNSSGNSWGMRMGSSAANSNRLDFVIDAFGSPVERMSITSGGNVGIGTTSPAELLDVRNAYREPTSGEFTQLLSSITTQDAGRGGSLGFGGFTSGTSGFTSFSGIKGFKENGDGGNTAGALAFYTRVNGGAIGERMRITSGGRVGIGFTSPVAKLSVRGEDNTSSNYAFEAANNSGASLFYVRNDGATFVVGTITSSGGFFNSDIRLKDLIDYDYNVSDIKPITYLWKDGRDNKKHVGYSAQEVQKVMPDAVNEDDKGFLSVNYVEILVAKISQMEKEIAYLKSKI